MELPDLDESDMPDIRSLTPEELEKVPFDKVKWCCCIKHCGGSTVLKDYGIRPWFRWRKRWLFIKPRIYFCGKHSKRYRKKYNFTDIWWAYVPTHYIKPGGGMNHLKA